MMKLIAPFLLLFSSLLFAREVLPIPAVIDPAIDTVAIPLFVEEVVEPTETDQSKMPVINLHSKIKGDFVLHEFVRAGLDKIVRQIIFFDSEKSTLEYLIYSPMDMSWETYMALSSDEKILMLDVVLDKSPTRYVVPITAEASYRTPKSQLFGLLNHLENILDAGGDSAALMRSLASLLVKSEEVTLEISELRKMLKATTTCN